MKFSEFKSIIRHIKKSIPCQECGHSFRERDITVLGMMNNLAYLSLSCPECKAQTVVQISMVLDAKGEVSFKHKLGIGEPITKDEILDMHNFLKDFKGDIKKYLNNPK